MNAFKTELHELVARHVAAAPAPKMLRLVEALTTDANIPGVRVYAERQLAAGAA